MKIETYVLAPLWTIQFRFLFQSVNGSKTLTHRDHRSNHQLLLKRQSNQPLAIPRSRMEHYFKGKFRKIFQKFFSEFFEFFYLNSSTVLIIIEFGDAAVVEQVKFSFEVANLQLDWIGTVSEVATTSGKLLISTILKGEMLAPLENTFFSFFPRPWQRNNCPETNNSDLLFLFRNMNQETERLKWRFETIFANVCFFKIEKIFVSVFLFSKSKNLCQCLVFQNRKIFANV